MYDKPGSAAVQGGGSAFQMNRRGDSNFDPPFSGGAGGE